MKEHILFPYEKVIRAYKSAGDSFYDIGFKYAGSILFIYVWWVLLESTKKGVKKLYFIARDGYPLYEIATIFVEKFNLNIECKYLYCSRKSLILPSINSTMDEELANLTKYSVKSTIDIILNRINATNIQKENIISDMQNSNIFIDIDKNLSVAEHNVVQKFLITSNAYIQALKDNASKTYVSTSSYLKQEGLYDNDNVYIVDIGWAGSIQKYLSKIISIEKKDVKVHAFYFGTLNSTYLNNNEDLFDVWYFGKGKHNIARAKFAINIMESVCTAPHGTTLHYEKVDTCYKPILTKTNDNISVVTTKINAGITDFASKIILYINFKDFQKNTLHKHTFSICNKLMYMPSKQLVNCFNKFVFCDDITNSYLIPLIDSEDVDKLYCYSIFKKLYYKMAKKQYGDDYKELMWPYGVASKLPFLKRHWYRLNIFFVFCFRYKKLIR